MFRVVPDQLRVSDGWVRCGQCDEVFDATAQLVVEEPSGQGGAPGSATVAAEYTPQAAPESADALAPSDVQDDAHDLEPMSVDIDIDTEADIDIDFGDTPQADTFLEQNPHAVPPLAFEPEPVEPEEDASDHAEPPRQDQDQDPRPDAVPRYQQADVQQGPAAADPKLSFMRPTRARSRRLRPWARVALVLLSLVLIASLLLQVAVQERDRIAATEPATQPFLESICAVLACKVSPLRKIESVVIDSSSFTKVRADVYRLNFTLKNTALTAVATPAVELTLTDLQDQSVVRRVFLAQDFGVKQTVMAPGSELAASLSVSVNLSGDAAHISGYRLLAFYP